MAKVAIIGSGAREHAISYSLVRKKHETFVIPGNSGMKEGMKVLLDFKIDFGKIKNFLKEEKIDYVIVGPEEPLVNGIKDSLKDVAFVYGPSKKESILEGSKAYAKEFMSEYGIKTASFEIFDEPKKAREYVDKKGVPIVVKASGLALGKGSFVCWTKMEAYEAIKKIMEDKIFGESGNVCVIEEFLKGVEISLIVSVAGDEYLSFITSQDHKQVFDDDKGPNTGGMGAYGPCPFVSHSLLKDIDEKIVRRTIKGMVKRGFEYQGFLYFGLMLKDDGPYVLEYNVRMGDPEGQVLLYLLETDLLEIVEHTKNFNLLKISKLKFKEGYACYVVIASKGYPDRYEKGKLIRGYEKIKSEDMKVFFAGVKEVDGNLYTDGGRVMGVLGYGKTLEEAISKAYEGVKFIEFEGMHYRRDIGKKGLILKRGSIPDLSNK
ncbi:MAG: phosphoribosylamine--glycine ligase [Candidatus Hydrothermales bacterium]